MGVVTDLSGAISSTMARFVVKTEMAREALSEFVGTFILVFFSIAGPLNLKLSGIDNQFLAIFASLTGLFLGVTASFSNSGAHINPIVTTSFATRGLLPWRKVPHYIVSQYLGAFLGAAVAYVNFADGIALLDGGRHVFAGSQNATGIFFATYPNPHVSFLTCIFDTMLCSSLLLFAIAAITDQYNTNVPTYLYAPFFTAAVLGIIGTFSFNCAVAINPARDLSPRIFTALAGYGLEGFMPHKGVFWLLAVVVPHVGGFIGIHLYHFSIGMQKPGEEERIAQKKADASTP